MLLIPFITFARGSSGAILVLFILMFSFVFDKKEKTIIATFAGVGLFMFISLYWSSLENYIDGALNINLKTGEGTSSRYYLWRQGFELVSMNPTFGHGMTSERVMYAKVFQGEMSHNIFLRYWIELGTIGLLLFIATYAKFSITKIKQHILGHTPNRIPLVQFILMFSFFAADIFGQVQYFDKLHYMILLITTSNFTFVNKTLTSKIT